MDDLADEIERDTWGASAMGDSLDDLAELAPDILEPQPTLAELIAADQ